MVQLLVRVSDERLTFLFSMDPGGIWLGGVGGWLAGTFLGLSAFLDWTFLGRTYFPGLWRNGEVGRGMAKALDEVLGTANLGPAVLLCGCVDKQ